MDCARDRPERTPTASRVESEKAGETVKNNDTTKKEDPRRARVIMGRP
jgi:hypothetical protein